MPDDGDLVARTAPTAALRRRPPVDDPAAFFGSDTPPAPDGEA